VASDLQRGHVTMSCVDDHNPYEDALCCFCGQHLPFKVAVTLAVYSPN